MRSQLELDIALLMGARSVSYKADPAEPRGVWKDLGHRLSHFVDAPNRSADTFGQTPGHRAGRIEDDHGIFDTWLVQFLSARGADHDKH
jgi:hypothetical protein